MVGVGVDGFRFEDHEHDGTGDDEGAAQPGGGSHDFIPEGPAEEDVEENLAVHQKGHDEGIDVLKRPGHEHLRRESKEAEADDEAPIRPLRQDPRLVSGNGKADENAENLKVENDFRIRAETFFSQATDDNVRGGGEETAGHPVQRVEIKFGEIPNLHDAERAGRDGEEPRDGFFREAFFQKERREEAHEKGGELRENLRIAQRQPFDGEEIKEEGDAAEKAAKAEHRDVPPGEKFFLRLQAENRDEEEPHEPAKERHFARRHIREPFGAGGHEGEGQRGQDRRDDAHGDATLSSFRRSQCHFQTPKGSIGYVFCLHDTPHFCITFAIVKQK